MGLCVGIAGLFCVHTWHDASVQVAAQSTIDSIKTRITNVVASVDGRVSSETKNRLINVISGKIRTTSNAVIVDIYVHFLREVKKLRTADQIVPISADTSNNTVTIAATNIASWWPDFMVTFASVAGSVQLDQKFATLTVKIKNSGTTYSSDGLGSLKFGCKGVDWEIYPYRSYLETAPPITTNNEVVFEVPNVYIGNLTSNKGFKILVCKIDSSDLISESNEQNNQVNVNLQVY